MGAERALRDEPPRVVGTGVAGGERGFSKGLSISPIQATAVWFHGVASEER
jgi:6-phosphogluconate dehydrogenase